MFCFVISSLHVWSVVCILAKQQPCFSFYSPGIPVANYDNPSLLTQAAQTCAWVLFWPQAQVTCARQVWGKHSVIHLENTSAWSFSGGDPGSPFLSFRDVSGTLHHWKTPDGMDRGNFAEIAGRSASLVVFPAGSRVAGKHMVLSLVSSPPELQMASWAPEVCAASLSGIGSKLRKRFHVSREQLKTQFLSSLRVRARRGHRVGKSQKVGKLIFNVSNSLGLASCSKCCTRRYSWYCFQWAHLSKNLEMIQVSSPRKM